MIICVRDIVRKIVSAVRYGKKMTVCERNQYAAHDICIDQTNYRPGMQKSEESGRIEDNCRYLCRLRW